MGVVNRISVKVTGIVQGVGFRPFVYNLAKSLYLNGWVMNTGEGVNIEVEGERSRLDEFIDSLKKNAPHLAVIKSVVSKEMPFYGYSRFEIRESNKGNELKIYISPDIAVCSQCEKELFDRDDRRYLYPFINCTNCGPRFTIVTGTPYDRINTTMKSFKMCPACEKEYTEPTDRRYHAQPVACFECGPSLELLPAGEFNEKQKDKRPNIVLETCSLIKSGHIIALKGLGGYHLVCDAENEKAVKTLRSRKSRDEKPFAVMVGDVESALRYCHIGNKEKELLESEKRPIVLLKKRENISLPEDIAPGNRYLGVMLPYTPIHLLMFHYMPNTVLIMTSGNKSNEPVYFKDAEAFENLSGIADYFLTNNRDIFIRTDDSVTRVFEEQEYIIRRSRGYVPAPLSISTIKLSDTNKTNPSILACGGELKNTFCMGKENEFYLSHHIGDLENSETLTSFEEGIEHFKKIFEIDYDVVAYDLHPEYLSTKFALAMEGKKLIGVQHHHAHIASVMAENDLTGEVIGVAFDGTGYGEDGNLWGGEFFTGSYEGFNREGHLKYIKMPGGEMAVKEPWRMAVSYLDQSRFVSSDKELAALFPEVNTQRLSAITQILDKNINCPLTSSMGRLFDAISALIGIRTHISYEGQAAIELEQISDEKNHGSYNFSIINGEGIFKVDTQTLIKEILQDLKSGVANAVIGSKFHEAVANLVIDCCRYIRDRKGINRVALSGGVFQNMLLLGRTISKLEMDNFKAYTHGIVPSNDGGLALGQAVIAAVKFAHS